MRHHLDFYKTEYDLGYKTHVATWDDPLELAEAVAAVARENGYVPREEYLMPARKGWAGRDFANWEEVRQATIQPWEDGMALVRQMIDKLGRVPLPLPRSVFRKPCWSEDAGDFDLGRYQDGQEPWRSVGKRDNFGKQFVTLVVHVGANSDTAHRTLFWRGAVASALVEVVEAQGYRATVYAYAYGHNRVINRDSNHHLTLIRLKREEEALDLPALVNAVSPWYFRTALLGAVALCPKSEVGPCHGVEDVAQDRLLLSSLGESPDADLWKIENVWSLESALELATLYLKRLSYEEGQEGEV